MQRGKDAAHKRANELSDGMVQHLFAFSMLGNGGIAAMVSEELFCEKKAVIMDGLMNMCLSFIFVIPKFGDTFL